VFNARNLSVATTAAVLAPFAAPSPQGVNVAAGDLDKRRPGRAVHPRRRWLGRRGRSPPVVVLNGRTGAVTNGFLPFVAFNGSVSLATLDVDNDGRAEPVAGALDPLASHGHVKRFGPTFGEVDSFLHRPQRQTRPPRRCPLSGAGKLASDREPSQSASPPLTTATFNPAPGLFLT